MSRKEHTHPIILRFATIEYLSLLQHWDQQQHHIDAVGTESDWNWEVELLRRPPWREQLIAELAGRPIGFVQIIDPATEETHYWGDVPPNLRAIDIWIGEAEDIGRGYGTVMMQQALIRCFCSSAVEAVLIDPLFSNKKAIRFYKKLGFVIVKRRIFAEEDCVVMKLTREKWLKNSALSGLNV